MSWPSWAQLGTVLGANFPNTRTIKNPWVFATFGNRFPRTFKNTWFLTFSKKRCFKINVDSIIPKPPKCKTSYAKLILCFRRPSKCPKTLKAKVAKTHGNLMILLLNHLKISLSQDAKNGGTPVQNCNFWVGEIGRPEIGSSRSGGMREAPDTP